MSADLSDRSFGDAFERYWAPVIAPSARALLDRLASTVGGNGPLHIVDVGTGTGTLVIAALERWPNARATGIDPSARMLELARRAADRRGRDVSDRLELITGYGDEIPMDDRTVDLAISSFAIQLVESRERMLTELARVLRPDGVAAVVTWRGTRDSFEPDRVVQRAFDELRIKPAEDFDDTRPYASAQEAESEFTGAGFEEVDAQITWLEHAFSADGYIAVAENWFDRETFEELDKPMRNDLRRLLRRRLATLRPSQLTWRRDLVSVVAKLPADERLSPR